MEKKDILFGKVKYLIDGGAFKIEVERVESNNLHEYRNQEDIRINKLKITEIIALAIEERPIPYIERLLKAKEVLCVVNSREPGGQIEADVFIV